ncbi:MAG: T9SS type A sorting domain-containing protein [Chitinophagales bacterium]
MQQNNTFRLLVFLSLFFFFSANFNSLAQVPIALDGQFDDWDNFQNTYNDTPNDGSDIDFLSLEIANDQNYLYLFITTNDVFKLTEDNYISLYIDADNNFSTGYYINGIGAELEYYFGYRDGTFYVNNNEYNIYWSDIEFHSLPTVTGNRFEIAIARNVLPNNIHPLFTSNTIQVALRDWSSVSNGDILPNNGETFSYDFNSALFESYTPIDLAKENPEYVRLLTYNVLSNGLLNSGRKQKIAQVVQAVSPNIITFNECWDVTAAYAKNFMDETLPLNNEAGWQITALDYGNITASRYDILANWQIWPEHRLTASLIDLPNNIYTTDLLVINAHLKCCGNGDNQRQQEVDAIAEFILDLKEGGGNITLPPNTPFVISGDLNLVGDFQQLETLITGDIVNTFSFGNGAPLDWDNSDLEDVVALQSDIPMAYTWYGQNESFPPSRLDFAIYSNSVMDVKKAFTLQTEKMSGERLNMYNLNFNTTGIASDHFPKVTDFEIATYPLATTSIKEEVKLNILSNPTHETVNFSYQLPQNAKNIQLSLSNIYGQVFWQKSTKKAVANMEINLSDVANGIYILKIEHDKQSFSKKVLKID